MAHKRPSWRHERVTCPTCERTFGVRVGGYKAPVLPDHNCNAVFAPCKGGCGAKIEQREDGQGTGYCPWCWSAKAKAEAKRR